MAVELTDFSLYEKHSTDFYRSRSKGTVTGYEVRHEEDSPAVVLEVFEHTFNTEYPSSHPVPVDQTPRTVFFRRAVDFMADSIGTSFYKVNMTELFAR